MTPPGWMRSRRVGGLLMAIAMLAVLAACGGGDGEEGADAASEDQNEIPEELTDVELGIGLARAGPATSYYTSLPIALGYWEEEGLDVEILPFAGGGEMMQALDAGQIDIGASASTTLFTGVASGADMIAFFSHGTRNMWQPHVAEDSDIETVLDLEGRNVGVASLASAGVLMVRALVEIEGGDPDSIEFLPVGVGQEAIEFLESGEVDALGLWDGPHTRIEALGHPLRPVSTPFFDDLGFQQAVTVRESEFDERREQLIGVARGIAKGMVFAFENPEAAVLAHWEVFPDTKPDGVSDEEAMEQALLELEPRLERSEPVDGRWGYAPIEQVENYQEILIAGGDLDEELPLDSIWTEELLDEVNDFDASSVEEDARNYGQ